MRLQRPAAGAGAAIALTPLIDVVFILLIFFMLASRFDQWNGFTMALGSAGPDPGSGPASGQAGEKNERTIVLFDLLAGDRVALGGRILEADAIVDMVDTKKARTVGHVPAFGVRAEPGSSIAGLVALLEDLKRAGAGEVSLVPIPSPGPVPSPEPAVSPHPPSAPQPGPRQ